jgi:general stress protein 26
MANAREHFQDMIEGFDTAMLVSHEGTDVWHARPMAIARTNDGGQFYFATSLDSPKVTEIKRDPRVLLTMQGTGQYVAIQGTAELRQDRRLIDELWSESWKLWFPKGKEDPALCILSIHPKSAEYWDNSGMQGLKYLFEGTKAMLQGKQPDASVEQHAKITV